MATTKTPKLLITLIAGTALNLLGSSVTASCGKATFPAGDFSSGVTQTGANVASCNLDSLGLANSSVQLSFAQNTGDWNTLSTNFSVYGNEGFPFPGLTHGQLYQAQATTDWNSVLQTAGPIRSGYLQVSYTNGGIKVGGFSVGPLGVTTGIVQTNPYTPITEVACPITSNGLCNPSVGYYRDGYPLIPFVLGTTFTIESKGAVGIVANQGDPGGANANTNYQFRFVEADGMAAVAASEVPEPSTWTTLLGGLAVFIGSVYRKRVGTKN